MTRRLLFFFLFFWRVVAQAQTPAPLLEQAFFKDPAAQVPFEQVLTAPFQPYDGNLSLGFQPGVVWLRLTMAPAGPGEDGASRRRVVRIGPNNLERIELRAMADGRWERQVRGALTPEASRDCPDDMHCFVTQASASGVSTVYLRIEHRGYLGVQAEVLSPDALPQAVAKRVRALTASLIMALGLLIVGLGLLLIDRSVLLLVYCAFQAVVVLFIASNAGVLASFFPGLGGARLGLVNNFLYVLRVVLTGLLAWTVLRPHRPGRLFQQVGQLLLLLCVINALLVLAGQMQWALQGSLLVLSMIPFWHLYGTLSARDLPVALRRVLIVGSSIYILVLMLGLLLAFADPPTASRAGFIRQIADWRLNGLAVGALFFWITMMERSTQKLARAQEVEALRLQALEAKARKAELDERSSLIDMLTHELKNPLGTIRFAVASLRQSVTGSDRLQRIQSIDLSARRMDDLIERVAHFSKVERATASNGTARLDMDAVLHELLADVAAPERWDVQVQPGATLHCDRQLLWVILENLVSNAEKYSVPNQTIRVDVTMQDGLSAPRESRESAADSGPAGRTMCLEISNPVDPELIPDESNLFERYYRHSHVQGKAGMGLGLSVARSAAHKMGASLAYRYAGERVFFVLQVPA